MPQFDAGGGDPVPHRVRLGAMLEWISDRISLERKERVSRYIAICPGHLRMNMKSVSSPANPAWPTTTNYIFVLGTCDFGLRSQQRLRAGGPSDDTRSLRGGCFCLLWRSPRRFCITRGSYGAGSAPSEQWPSIAMDWRASKIAGPARDGRERVSMFLTTSMRRTWTCSARGVCLNCCLQPAPGWARMRSHTGYFLLRGLRTFDSGMELFLNFATN